MSRRCPKRNHLFLNWLKANRSRFSFEPQINKIKGRHIEGHFDGVTEVLRFQVSSWCIGVAVIWNKECWDFVADFDVVEKRSKQGLFCSLCMPDEMTYYPTQADLWTEHGFEPFLAWCNDKLVTNQWLALYEYGEGGCTEAKLQKDNKAKESPALQELLKGLKPLGESQAAFKKERDVTQNLVQMMPLFKSSRISQGADNEAGI